MCCEIWGSHSDVPEDSGLLGCEAVSLGLGFTTSRRSIARSSSTVTQSKKIFLVCSALEDSCRTGLLDRWRWSFFETSGTLQRQWVTSLKTWIQNFLLAQAYNVVIIFVCWATSVMCLLIPHSVQWTSLVLIPSSTLLMKYWSVYACVCWFVLSLSRLLLSHFLFFFCYLLCVFMFFISCIVI